MPDVLTVHVPYLLERAYMTEGPCLQVIEYREISVLSALEMGPRCIG